MKSAVKYQLFKEIGANFTVLLSIFFCALVLLASGCSYFAQLGETSAEGRRRHIRNQRINRQALMGDLDRALLLDEPSKLTNKRIP